MTPGTPKMMRTLYRVRVGGGGVATSVGCTLLINIARQVGFRNRPPSCLTATSVTYVEERGLYSCTFRVRKKRRVYGLASSTCPGTVLRELQCRFSTLLLFVSADPVLLSWKILIFGGLYP
ncbi:hypothetical protein J6590_001107 [Homalodisca vitripennis]|nr:hypothetical protein J6590_001107 [Homalodisca vitripennis]